VLSALPCLSLSRASYVSAARLYRNLRARGVTVGGTVDCLIAQACIETNATLLTADRDFDRIAAHTALRLARLSPPAR
jgi:predicted nucleic acid-binding protein